MSKGDRYVKLVEWSDEDACFIGSCPELFYGGCHGADAKAVLSELCEIVEDSIGPSDQTAPESGRSTRRFNGSVKASQSPGCSSTRRAMSARSLMRLLWRRAGSDQALIFPRSVSCRDATRSRMPWTSAGTDLVGKSW